MPARKRSAPPPTSTRREDIGERLTLILLRSDAILAARPSPEGEGAAGEGGEQREQQGDVDHGRRSSRSGAEQQQRGRPAGAEQLHRHHALDGDRPERSTLNSPSAGHGQDEERRAREDVSHACSPFCKVPRRRLRRRRTVPPRRFPQVEAMDVKRAIRIPAATGNCPAGGSSTAHEARRGPCRRGSEGPIGRVKPGVNAGSGQSARRATSTPATAAWGTKRIRKRARPGADGFPPSGQSAVLASRGGRSGEADGRSFGSGPDQDAHSARKPSPLVRMARAGLPAGCGGHDHAPIGETSAIRRASALAAR